MNTNIKPWKITDDSNWKSIPLHTYLTSMEEKLQNKILNSMLKMDSRSEEDRPKWEWSVKKLEEIAKEILDNKDLPENNVTIGELLSVYKAHKAREAELTEQYGKEN